MGQSRGLLEQHVEDSQNLHVYLPKPLYLEVKSGLSVSSDFSSALKTQVDPKEPHSELIMN